MDLGNLGLFKLMSRKMDWLTQRQEALSQNIANADTPDYKTKDLKSFTFRDALSDSRRLTPTATNASHLAGTRGAGGMAQEQTVRDPYETAPDGNNVILEDQMMKMSQNSMDYQTITNLYKKQVNMIKSAIRTGG
ncbi:flagellar basal body rod protein FlgB [Azospirillum doebereinerae]|uniref:Flagellar basal body rod protein FlgB n=1 Tax=Azospirillum doebereinerae TaxID=92933 RepID=A0A433J2C8_9PROT|nr:flagellar basal body rod protein FlgB [Azospirillum doebereinerae]MCG5243286.1 flagellar basal body rod protein FlgB [Azospirillum doebereinerae]RUQ65237.1 flagellar basal body rod protein FlgB [Azospirillum doebereinerae]